MNKYIVTFLIYSFLLLGVNSPLSANEVDQLQNDSLEQTNLNTSSGYNTRGGSVQVVQKTREEVKAMREDAKAKMEELKSFASTLKDKKEAKNQLDRILGRENALSQFDKAISMVSGAKEKIELQIPKLKALGIDTKLFEVQLKEAQEKLNKSEELIAKANSILSSTGKELTKEQKTELRKIAQEAQSLIKDAHGILVGVVKDLREALRKKRQNPTQQTPTIVFTANPERVNKLGEVSSLSWRSTEANKCIGTLGQNNWEGEKPTSGEFTTGPIYGPNEFIITCSNEAGSTSKSLSVMITLPTTSSPNSCPSYAPAPTGCEYVESGKTDSCGPVLTLSCNSPAGGGGTSGPTDEPNSN